MFFSRIYNTCTFAYDPAGIARIVFIADRNHLIISLPVVYICCVRSIIQSIIAPRGSNYFIAPTSGVSCHAHFVKGRYWPLFFLCYCYFIWLRSFTGLLLLSVYKVEMQLLHYVGLSRAFRTAWPKGTSRIKRKSLKCPRQSGQLNTALVSRSDTTTRFPLHFAKVAGFKETLARNSSFANSAFDLYIWRLERRRHLFRRPFLP